MSAPRPDILVQVVGQGLLAGVLGMGAFGIAVTRLGPSATAVSGAVVPAATAIGGWFFLGEGIAASTLAGILIMVAGLVAITMGKETKAAATLDETA